MEKCKLKHPVAISLPPKSPPRERWLTPSEASRLLLGSLGCILAPYSDLATKTERWAIWRREPAVVSHHLARFVLIGLRTGTRHDAINGLAWEPPEGGWFDLDNKVMYRAAPGERQTPRENRQCLSQPNCNDTYHAGNDSLKASMWSRPPTPRFNV